MVGTGRAQDASGAAPDDETGPLLPALRRVLPSASAVETGAIFAAGFGFLAGFIVGYLATGGQAVQISGYGSVGGTSAVVAPLVGAVAFVVGALSPRVPKHLGPYRPPGRVARWTDLVALTFAHAAIVFQLVIGTAAVVALAFRGAPVYSVPAAALTGGVTAVAAYFCFLSATSMDASKLATLLAVFLIGGALTSMLSTTDANWWHSNISALGIANDFSGWAFNLTVILGGFVLLTLARFVGGELDRWAAGRGAAAVRGARIVAWAIALLGLCLIVVGLVPVNLSEPLHNIAATGMMAVFAALAVGLPWLLPGFPRAFVWLGWAFAGAIAFAALLFWPLGYYTLTATELIAVALIFAWLVIFIRNVAADADDREIGAFAADAPGAAATGGSAAAR